MRLLTAILGLGATLGLVATAGAGITDTPLPTFSDGHAAQVVALVPGVIKSDAIETDVICTNLAPAAVDVGFEVFDVAGVRANRVSTGNGALLAVAPGRTVTIATGGTAVMHEDATIALEAPVTEIANGSARVVATDVRLACNAFTVDSLHTVESPNKCSTCKPPTLANLGLSYVAASPPPPPPPPSPCPATPRSGCRKPAGPGRAMVLLKDRTPDELDTLLWKWTGATPTAKADFGDPFTTTGYALCVYDHTGGTLTRRFGAAMPFGGTCGTRPCWKNTTTGYVYVDSARTPDGVAALTLHAAGSAGAKLILQGKGAHLPLSGLPLTTPVTVQLSSDNGPCWSADYSSPTLNNTGNFKAKSD
ncbi:MAG TPA: hypothetical protein VLI07_09055 [Candidatus Binatus sp.]|nr:hypothetical protein [Candidatus Binatus sp.]